METQGVAEQSTRPQPISRISAPSGIAQLRKTSEANLSNVASDPMNLDDFIVPTSIGTPAGLPTPSSTETAGPVHQVSLQPNGIPINNKQKPNVQTNIPAASVPKSAIPAQHAGFDGVPKRVRKTSIDERRSVSSSVQGSIYVLTSVVDPKTTRRLLTASATTDCAQ
jgi:GATA-binding protein, other eukaryote